MLECAQRQGLHTRIHTYTHESLDPALLTYIRPFLQARCTCVQVRVSGPRTAATAVAGACGRAERQRRGA